MISCNSILAWLTLFYLFPLHGSTPLFSPPISLTFAPKLGIKDAPYVNTNFSEWSDDSQLPKFMVRLYNKVIDRTEQNPTEAMNLLGFGNKKIFANSLQILFPISVLKGDFGVRYQLRNFNYNVSLLEDRYITGYANMRIFGNKENKYYRATILAVSRGKIITLANKQFSSRRNHIIPLHKFSIKDGLFTLVILSDKEDYLNMTTNVVLYSQDKQASNLYWQHNLRKKRSATDTPKHHTISDQCQKYNLYVSFKEIGWSNWILYPKGYYLNFCYGMCPIPLLSHFNVTNHSILQNSLYHLNNPSVPPVCCTPTQLNPLTIIYSDPITNRYVMKVYLDMQVAACGCR